MTETWDRIAAMMRNVRLQREAARKALPERLDQVIANMPVATSGLVIRRLTALPDGIVQCERLTAEQVEAKRWDIANPTVHDHDCRHDCATMAGCDCPVNIEHILNAIAKSPPLGTHCFYFEYIGSKLAVRKSAQCWEFCRAGDLWQGAYRLAITQLLVALHYQNKEAREKQVNRIWFGIDPARAGDLSAIVLGREGINGLDVTRIFQDECGDPVRDGLTLPARPPSAGLLMLEHLQAQIKDLELASGIASIPPAARPLKSGDGFVVDDPHASISPLARAEGSIHADMTGRVGALLKEGDAFDISFACGSVRVRREGSILALIQSPAFWISGPAAKYVRGGNGPMRVGDCIAALTCLALREADATPARDLRVTINRDTHRFVDFHGRDEHGNAKIEQVPISHQEALRMRRQKVERDLAYRSHDWNVNTWICRSCSGTVQAFEDNQLAACKPIDRKPGQALARALAIPHQLDGDLADRLTPARRAGRES